VAIVSTVFAAARNNAEWCDAFCRAHGVTGRFDDDAWWSGVRTPPLYPDAVTLVRHVDARAILARVDAAAGCSVKDSFGDLDLAGHGFQILFRAEWLCLDRAEAPTPGWSVVESVAALAQWETAWGEPPAPRPFFCPGLLAEEAVAVLARYETDRIAGDAVANRGAGVIGLSNVFDGSGDLTSAYRGAAGAAQAAGGRSQWLATSPAPSARRRGRSASSASASWPCGSVRQKFRPGRDT
jgi:hypothetical protein